MLVLRKATEKEQSKRYQTALEFKQAIQNALLPDPTPWEQFTAWIQSHIGLVIGLVIGFAVLVFTILFILLT